jgi:hypothetical protein
MRALIYRKDLKFREEITRKKRGTSTPRHFDEAWNLRRDRRRPWP